MRVQAAPAGPAPPPGLKWAEPRCPESTIVSIPSAVRSTQGIGPDGLDRPRGSCHRRRPAAPGARCPPRCRREHVVLLSYQGPRGGARACSPESGPSATPPPTVSRSPEVGGLMPASIRLSVDYRPQGLTTGCAASARARRFSWSTRRLGRRSARRQHDPRASGFHRWGCGRRGPPPPHRMRDREAQGDDSDSVDPEHGFRLPVRNLLTGNL